MGSRIKGAKGRGELELYVPDKIMKRSVHHLTSGPPKGIISFDVNISKPANVREILFLFFVLFAGEKFEWKFRSVRQGNKNWRA